MFDSDTLIHMVRFVLFSDWDRDEDHGFHLINPGCVVFFSIHDCLHDPF